MPRMPRGGKALSRAASGRVPGPSTTNSSLNGIMLMIIFITVLMVASFEHSLLREQRLADGRWMIVEPQPGRVFEIDASGRTVWEWGHQRRADGVSISEVLEGTSYTLSPEQLNAIRSR